VFDYALYEAVGKVEGAISQHADTLLHTLPEDEQGGSFRRLSQSDRSIFQLAGRSRPIASDTYTTHQRSSHRKILIMKNKTLAGACLIVLAACMVTSTFGQQSASAPFAELDDYLKSNPGWYGDHDRLAELFNIGRKNLGDRFEPELMKYLGKDKDVEKHYWISVFLEEPTYLQGASPLPRLSLRIKERGLGLLKGKDDVESFVYVVTLSVTAAMVSERLGLRKQATAHKVRAEGLMKKDPFLLAGWPAMYEEEQEIYKSIPPQYEMGGKKYYPVWKAAETESVGSPGAPRPKKIDVQDKVLQERAIKKAEPVYPPDARAAGVSGVVMVYALVSEEGRVIEVTAFDGPEQLREAAIEAARQWTFKPTTHKGQPVRMEGRLSFNFALK
jgi:TonB family protein